MKEKDVWVLRLKQEAKDSDMKGDWYFQDLEYDEFLTQDLNQATIIKDKEAEEESMKLHERNIIEIYGEEAICIGGYTNMMERFEWVEAELFESTEEEEFL